MSECDTILWQLQGWTSMGFAEMLWTQRFMTSMQVDLDLANIRYTQDILTHAEHSRLDNDIFQFLFTATLILTVEIWIECGFVFPKTYVNVVMCTIMTKTCG